MGCGSSSQRQPNSGKAQAKPGNQQANQPSNSGPITNGLAKQNQISTLQQIAGVTQEYEDEGTADDDFDEEFRSEFGAVRPNRQGQMINIFHRSAMAIKQDAAKVGFFEIEETGTGDQALAVKPWIGAIRAPSNPPQVLDTEPNVNLELEYVYGYRCFDTRQNIYYTANPNEIVYMAAAVGIVLDTVANTQKIFGSGEKRTTQGHIDDITALTIDSTKTYVATGEVGKNPKIIVWTASDVTLVKEFRQGRDSRAVTALAFNKDGNLLVSCALDDDHMVYVWEWKKSPKPLIYSDKGGPGKILDCAWSPVENKFVTAGISNIFFWDITESQKKRKGIFGKNKMTNLTTVQGLDNGNFVAGGSNGWLYIWQGNNCIKSIQAVQTGCSIHTLRAVGNTILCGGSDKNFFIMDISLNIRAKHQLQSIPRACDMMGQKIVVGLRDGTIQEISGQNQARTLMESHCDGEVWGLDVGHRGQSFVITSGDDNQVKVWDPANRKCVKTAILEATPGPKRRPGEGASTLANNSPNQQSRCVAYSPTTGHIAVAFNNGHIKILESIGELDTIRYEGKPNEEPKEWTETMKYSPNGKWLAVGSHDDHIYIYDTTNYKLKSKKHKHHSFLTALDWSRDSQSLHSTSGDYELLYWNISDLGKLTQIPSGATEFRDEPWETYSTHFGWPVQGIFGGIIDYTHVNRVDRSRDSKFYALGNDYGQVEIFHHPNREGSKSKQFRAHSEHVTNVKWSQDNKYVWSTGGYDQCLMQWKVTYT